MLPITPQEVNIRTFDINNAVSIVNKQLESQWTVSEVETGRQIKFKKTEFHSEEINQIKELYKSAGWGVSRICAWDTHYSLCFRLPKRK